MSRSLTIRSMTVAESDFLRAGRNEQLIWAVTGAGSRNDPAPALWDAVSLRHGVRCSTWHEAFRACCVRGPSGERSWAWFDLATLRQCIPGLDLPAWVYEYQADAAAAEWAAWAEGGWASAEQAAWYADGGGLDEEMAQAGALAEWDAEELAEALHGDAEWVTEDQIEWERPAAWDVPVLRLLRSVPPPLPAWAWRAA